MERNRKKCWPLRKCLLNGRPIVEQARLDKKRRFIFWNFQKGASRRTEDISWLTKLDSSTWSDNDEHYLFTQKAFRDVHRYRSSDRRCACLDFFRSLFLNFYYTKNIGEHWNFCLSVSYIEKRERERCIDAVNRCSTIQGSSAKTLAKSLPVSLTFRQSSTE